jgi:hypothetical protein
MNPFITGIFFLVIILAAVLGTRMLMLARRTGRLPELCIAVFAFGTGPGSFLQVFGRGVGTLPPGWDVPVHMAGAIALSVAAIALGLFTWQVFRPGERWARLGFLAVSALVLMSVVTSLATPTDYSSQVHTPTSRSSLVWLLARGIFVAWACFESLRYWQAMRRRRGLGLADPVVVNRFFLFGTWTAGMLGLWLNSVVARLLVYYTGSNSFESTLYATGSSFGLVQILSLWLAFFPPQAYVQLLTRSENSRTTG